MNADPLSKLVSVDSRGIEPDAGAPSPDRIVAGDPRTRTWNVEDDGNGLYAGVWEATPGEWRVEYTEWEFFHVLSGVSELVEEGGEPVRLVAGDGFVIRPGFRGIWRVNETTVKRYVIRT